MATSEFPNVEISVALIMDESKQKFLWTWDEEWRAFCLPTRGLKHFPSSSGPIPNPSAAQVAAEQAAAKALGVPVLVKHVAVNKQPRLKPILQRSGGDGELKSYVANVFRAEAHPKFADRLHLAQPHVWLAGHESQSGDYRPLSVTSLGIISQLVDAGLVPGRNVRASTLLLWRGPDNAREYLMRMHTGWTSYFFPSKKQESNESPMDAAERSAKEELGLEPWQAVTLTSASDAPVTINHFSEDEKTDTFYIHRPFRASLQVGAQPSADRGLVWVPLVDIVGGNTWDPKSVSASSAEAHTVSPSARTILEFLGHC